MDVKRVGWGIVLVGGLLWIVLASFAAVSSGRSLSVVATTTIIGDVVERIGGEEIELTVLIPVGVDPHAFEPTPRDMVSLADADLVFINGAGLEQALIPLLESSGAILVDLSARIALRTLDIADDAAANGDGHSQGTDPHVWFDPTNVMIWSDEIDEALSEADPDHGQLFSARAADYRALLAELDAWIWDNVARLSRGQRLLITDHALLGYFAARYGFRQLGTVLPGFSSLSEPSARDVARLQDEIAASGVTAIFVGKTVNPALAQRIATDTHVSLVELYTGALGDAQGPAANYLQLMRTNTTNIVEALLGSDSE
ncbi:zinc ABC transporter substrate-binding protein [Candidatus Bipolaricaulota bacterium]|nr:zinc ABC transporter substrate-binding protein [Candidatus Bipolaricaulota bacterium]